VHVLHKIGQSLAPAIQFGGNRQPGLEGWRLFRVRRAEKCTLCSHRIDQGLEPFCAKECIWGALRFASIEGAKNQS